MVLDVIGGRFQEFVVDPVDGEIMEVFQHGQQFACVFFLHQPVAKVYKMVCVQLALSFVLCAGHLLVMVFCELVCFACLLQWCPKLYTCLIF